MRTYGYSTAAMNSRYPPLSYSRTAYGYSGRSALHVGAPMFIYMGASRGHRPGNHYNRCEHYSGAAQTYCNQQYTNCKFDSNSSTLCSSKASSSLIRDDLMAATVDVTRVLFPLNITIHSAAVTFNNGSQPPQWQTPLLLSFSEVDLDDENDPDMELWVFCLLLSIGGVVLLVCSFSAWWLCCDMKCCCSKHCFIKLCSKCCCKRSTSSDVDLGDADLGERATSKEFDAEIGEKMQSKELDLEVQRYPTGVPVEGIPVQGATAFVAPITATPNHTPSLTIVELKP